MNVGLFLGDLYIQECHYAVYFLEVFLILVVAFSLWFCLRWRKRSRCGATQRSKDEVEFLPEVRIRLSPMFRLQ